MATIVRRKDRDGRPRPYWSYVIVDAQGRRREYRGDPSRRETERLAVEHEARERAIREGLRPRRALLADVIEQYLAWGSAQGGRRGKPWASKHAQTRRVALAEWVSELEVERIEDVRLVDVERVARAWSLRGRSAKTIRNMVEPLHALCRWAVRRELLARDPLAAWTAPKGRPKRARRPLTVDELRRLLSSVPAKRALQYEVALWTGYRFSELLALTPRELADGWIRLDEDASKRRWAESQPIPRELFERRRLAFAAQELHAAHRAARSGPVDPTRARAAREPRSHPGEVRHDIGRAEAIDRRGCVWRICGSHLGGSAEERPAKRTGRYGGCRIRTSRQT